MEESDNSSILLICPMRNEESYILELIQSLQKQTFGNWILAIYDNASSDASAQIVMREASRDSRIKLKLFSEVVPINESATRAWSNAIIDFECKYVGFIGGDDYLFENDYLEKAVLEFQSGAFMVTPRHLELLTDGSFGQTHTYKNLGKNPFLDRLLFVANSKYLHIFYSLFKRNDFIRVAKDPRARFSRYLMSDWWFTITALRLVSRPIKFLPSMTYVKRLKGISYDSTYYFSDSTNHVALGLRKVNGKSNQMIFKKSFGKLMILLDNILVVPIRMLFSERNRYRSRDLPEVLLYLLILFSAKMLNSVRRRVPRLFILNRR